MADLSITVNYRVPGKSCDWIRIVLFCIVWYALGVIAIAVNYHWLAQPHNYNWLSNFVIPLFGAMYAYFPFCVIAGRLKELNLFIDAAGMLIPPAFGIGSYRQVRWSELRSIDIDNYHRIRLTSISTKTKLDTTRLGAEEVEKVLLAIELFSPGTQWSQRSLQFKDSLHNGNAGVQGLTFTQMWDEELRRHFNATTFVPHEPGAKLRSGDLTIIRQLAFGGFSAVYLVEDRDRSDTLILKEHVIRSQDPELQNKARQMFQREATILSGLSHDNIARVVDHFTEQDRSYLLIEHIDGENLRTLVLRSGPLSENRVIALALEMINILGYLHHRQPPIIHRDFTPDNLMLSPSGKVTLIDFGTANEYVARSTGTLVGKQSYMPIEQVRGKADPRSDLYAFACTLYFLLIGKDPQPLSVCQTRLENPAVSEALDKIISRLTQTDPEDRYPDSEAVRISLESSGYFGS